MGGERRPSAWRSAAVRRSQVNLPLVALPASRERDLRRWHTHERALPLTARVGELRRRLWGAHQQGEPAMREG